MRPIVNIQCNIVVHLLLASFLLLAEGTRVELEKQQHLFNNPQGTSAGWTKYGTGPVFSGDPESTFFDVSMLNNSGVIKMWFSWRTPGTIGYSQSTDGIKWNPPTTALSPAGGWEGALNRPGVLFLSNTYHMWYTGQSNGHSYIGYARSPNGQQWTRVSTSPVLSPTLPWEKVAVMCPWVIYDTTQQIFKMWYSGGDQYEPDAIGYATSKDGVTWEKDQRNPIFTPIPANSWEQDRVTAASILPTTDGNYVIFYIGFHNVSYAQIGIARSKDGITGWQRHPQNPIISPGPLQWDSDATYKPGPLFLTEFGSWFLWYNGRHSSVEEIGLATHKDYDLGFPPMDSKNILKL